jgi:hypothetical protein
LLKIYVHGPIHAILAANNEPKSCPSVAPAPIKPNNLEPDWIKREIRIKKGKCTEEILIIRQIVYGTSLSMTSITLAQVDDMVMRLSKATYRFRELFKISYQGVTQIQIASCKSYEKAIPREINLF